MIVVFPDPTHFLFYCINSDPARTTPSIRPDVGVPRRRRSRTVYSNEALAKMEELFAETAYPDIDQRETLSATIGVPEARLQVQ